MRYRQAVAPGRWTVLHGQPQSTRLFIFRLEWPDHDLVSDREAPEADVAGHDNALVRWPSRTGSQGAVRAREAECVVNVEQALWLLWVQGHPDVVSRRRWCRQRQALQESVNQPDASAFDCARQHNGDIRGQAAAFSYAVYNSLDFGVVLLRYVLELIMLPLIRLRYFGYSSRIFDGSQDLDHGLLHA
ncbi:hypothetical protein TOPH_04955 [Tolypocladium ophioglossoides CBS 100239]|uniref:Uncharacterized protein n=1 Tax=Tolypocladium ophioglossoides (strain CBS 100239) TaxID=1163406 RepID=A0A0L0N8G6_TOLOC|nr:hypothetical protein TOPH_04955 [Tolypocladium ophioglossoides CBS 100239]